MLRRLFQDIPLITDVSHQAHHQFFPYGINGWIRNLSKTLLKVIEEQLRFVGQHSRCSLHTHGANGLSTFVRHR